jgi:DNA-binding IclR family transcriptional regulator
LFVSFNGTNPKVDFYFMQARPSTYSTLTLVPTSTQATAAPDAPAPSGLGVLEKAMSLLNIVSAAPAPMTFTELLRAGHLPKATLHRILATLMREGLLRYEAPTKTYHLELAHEVWSDFDLRLAAQDEIVRLRNALSQPVHLAVLDGDSIMIIASQDTEREQRSSSRVGVRLPVHASAAGKVIMAHMESLGLAALLDRLALQPLTERTVISREALKSEPAAMQLSTRNMKTAWCRSPPPSWTLRADPSAPCASAAALNCSPRRTCMACRRR